MSIFTTWLSDDVLSAYFDAGTPSDPAACYAGLLTTVTDQEAGTVVEASYTGYARVAASGKWAAPAAGLNGRSITSNAAITFGQKTDAGDVVVVAVGFYTALTGGNLMAVVFLDGGDPFVANAATTDTWTAPAHGMSANDQVRIQYIAGSQTPTGANENTTYYVGSPAADTFELGTTASFSTAIDITQAGSAMILPLTPKTISQNDTPEFASGSLEVALD